MKLTISSVYRLHAQLGKASLNLIQQTMRDNDMGLKDAYEKCKNDYYRKYGYPMPIIPIFYNELLRRTR